MKKKNTSHHRRRKPKKNRTVPNVFEKWPIIGTFWPMIFAPPSAANTRTTTSSSCRRPTVGYEKRSTRYVCVCAQHQHHHHPQAYTNVETLQREHRVAHSKRKRCEHETHLVRCFILFFFVCRSSVSCCRCWNCSRCTTSNGTPSQRGVNEFVAFSVSSKSHLHPTNQDIATAVETRYNNDNHGICHFCFLSPRSHRIQMV